MATSESITDRFWANVDKSGGPHACWLWTASADRDGYGRFSIDSRPYRAPRVAWLLTVGNWPAQHVLHDCDVPQCVNPRHLHEGSIRDNALEREARGRGVHYRGDDHYSRRRPEALARGERHGHAKLTPDIVRAARLRYAKGDVGYRPLAREYGVATMTLKNAIRRKTWQHVE